MLRRFPMRGNVILACEVVPLAGGAVCVFCSFVQSKAACFARAASGEMASGVAYRTSQNAADAVFLYAVRNRKFEA